MTRPRIALTSVEAAELLGVSGRTLKRWRDEGRGPAYCTAGRRVMYFEKDLVGYLEGTRVEPQGGGGVNWRR